MGKSGCCKGPVKKRARFNQCFSAKARATMGRSIASMPILYISARKKSRFSIGAQALHQVFVEIDAEARPIGQRHIAVLHHGLR